MFEVLIDKRAALQRLAVQTFAPPGEVAASIRERFGLPTSVTNLPADGLHAAEWVTADVVIKMLCATGRGCKVEFSTAALEASRLKDVEARKRAHPSAP